jgi:hypothetical protein
VIENGRNRGDPWSIRQTGIYHRWNTKSGHSVWIIVQPSQDALDELKRALYSTGTSCGCSARKSLSLHALLLISSSENWSKYIKDLHTRHSCIVSFKVISSSIIPRTLTIPENQIVCRQHSTPESDHKKSSEGHRIFGRTFYARTARQDLENWLDPRFMP